MALRAAALWNDAGSQVKPPDILRTTTTDDLQAYLAGSGTMETSLFGPAQQHEEAWFLGLRTNAGVDVAALRAEFGEDLLAPALETVRRLAEDGLLVFDGERVRLTARGRMISNDVFQEFLATENGEQRSVALLPALSSLVSGPSVPLELPG
jgi:oxygen-independent coproporphyrinogen-3 oxidase